MDEIDQAQEMIDKMQASDLKRHQLSREPDDNSGEDCEDCGTEIPIKRRQAKPGCRRCITCQETFELHHHWRAL